MTGPSVISSFSNIGHAAGGRLFSGFPAADAPRPIDIAPRQAARLDLAPGDIVRVEQGEGAELALMAFGLDGRRAEAELGLPAPKPLDTARFDAAPLRAWLAAQGSAQGGAPHADHHAVHVDSQDDALILSAASALTLWLLHPLMASDLVSGVCARAARVWHQPGAKTARLPAPLGPVRDEFTVTRGTARAYEVKRGEIVQIIDIDGQQCSDFQAMRLRGLDQGLEQLIDSTATRTMVRRAFPGPGLLDKFFDGEMRPLLRVVQDTCGRHDTLGLACTARGYEDRGFPGHVNCSDNITHALAPFGVGRRNAWPAINFFWNTWLDDQLHIQTEEAYSRPGDYVAMEALDDLLCVSTACPDDLDPINGWNPTDVHVRIYKAEAKLPRAIAYRTKEDAPMQVSRQSPFHDRMEPLTHHFAPARDLWTPVSYASPGVLGEYWACREAATLQDMSGLRKFDVIGPDAERLLQHAMTRNVSKLAVWRGTYALMCDDSGDVIDDGTLFRLGPELFRWCCGSEESGRWLQKLATAQGLQARIHDLGGSLPNLAIQGPKSRDILRNVVFTQPHVPALDQMKWFGVTIARLHDREGAPFMLSRSGYTGELGYEIFCAERDALTIWDALMAAGADHGITPMGTAALDIIRIEAGLAGAHEFPAGTDAFEAGLGFAVDLKKEAFSGRDALARNAEAQRKQLRGLRFDCDDIPRHGAPVFVGERQVGVVTSATRSPMLETAIAMARISVEHAELGTHVEVGQLDGRMKRLTAQIVEVPFVDPKRERARA
ncbi:MAG: DUF1989 domain-containing protein [Pseudomonadota bacterium]